MSSSLPARSPPARSRWSTWPRSWESRCSSCRPCSGISLRGQTQPGNLDAARRPTRTHDPTSFTPIRRRPARPEGWPHSSPGRARPRAVVHTFHGHVLSGYFSPTRERIFRVVERFLGRMTGALVAVSDEVRDDLVRFGVADASADRSRALRLRLAAVGPRPTTRRARGSGPGWGLARTRSSSAGREGSPRSSDLSTSSARCEPCSISASTHSSS